MKFKKLTALVAAMAAMSAMSVSVSAADWSQASYADNDPTTVKIISYDENSVTFTNDANSPDFAKCRITLDKILKNREDYSKIAKATWKFTYDGVKPDTVADSGLCGGTWCTSMNSKTYNIYPETVNEDESYVWANTSYTVEDEVVFTAETPVVKDGEFVFMDWSYADLGNQGITYTVSDFKLYDADGNEIEQLGLGEWTDGVEAAEPAETEEPAETDAPATDAPATEEHKPGDDNIEGNAQTGTTENVVIAGAVLAASAVALAVSKKRK